MINNTSPKLSNIIYYMYTYILYFESKKTREDLKSLEYDYLIRTLEKNS